MVKSFKESHAKDLEKLAADLQREEEKTATDDLVNTPKHTVLSVVGLTSPVWTLGMFQIVTGKSCSASDAPNRRIRATLVFDMLCEQCNKCGFVIRYQNTANLEQHYIRGGLDHKELAGRLAAMQQVARGLQLGAAADGNMALSRVWNAPAYDSTLLMQGAQYLACNLVMPQLYQMSLACVICE
jgi:hypothetical protein